MGAQRQRRRRLADRAQLERSVRRLQHVGLVERHQMCRVRPRHRTRPCGINAPTNLDAGSGRQHPRLRPGAGQLNLELDAVNAAGVDSRVAETLNVDNDPVGVSLNTPNDPDTTQWVGHPVTVDAAASAGPSGVGGMVCSTDGAPNQSYPAGGVSVDGDGVHTVSCTAWNQAEGPNGSGETGTRSLRRPDRRGAANRLRGRRTPATRPASSSTPATANRASRAGRSRCAPPAGGAWTAAAHAVRRPAPPRSFRRRRTQRPLRVPGRPPATTSVTARPPASSSHCRCGSRRARTSASRRSSTRRSPASFASASASAGTGRRSAATADSCASSAAGTSRRSRSSRSSCTARASASGSLATAGGYGAPARSRSCT